jgi:dolichyl-phosphate-mannose--protein O-mannosyl transferase
LPLVLVAVAGTLRGYELGQPARCYFDETYYYYDARDYLEVGVEQEFAVHPPVGKWLIASGLGAFGADPGSPVDEAVTEEPGGCGEEGNEAAQARERAESSARRLAPAIAGTLMVLFTFFAGTRLFRRRGIAAMAALLVAVDGLAFTMSRIAMLDVFLGLFVVVGFWLLLIDRDHQWANAVEPGERSELESSEQPRLPPRPRSYRWLAGLAFGLALATKWSALLAIGSAGLFVLGSELAWRRKLAGRALTQPWPMIASTLLTLVVVPLAVYLASYAGWFLNYPDTRFGQEECTEEAGCEGVSTLDIAGDWLQNQRDIVNFHSTLEAEHPYRAPAYGWLVLRRPVAYYYEDYSDECAADDDCAVEEGNVAEVLGIGNPAIWWLALPAYALLGFAAIRWRDWRAWALLAFIGGQYLPWLAAPRTLFLFYMTPVVPFICLTLAYVGWRALRWPYLRWVPAAIAGLAVAGFLFWWPLFTGEEIAKSAWDLRIWFDSWI